MRIGLAGSFGFGNLGDEAVPLALHDLCTALGDDIEFVPISRFSRVAVEGVLTRDKATDSFLNSTRIREIWHVGGGIVEPGSNSVLIRCGRNSTKVPQRIVAANVADSPEYGFLEKSRLRRLMHVMRHISVRDVASLAAIQKHFGLPLDAPVGDLVLWLSPNKSSNSYIDDSTIPDSAFAICNFCPVWIDEPGFLDWAAAVVATTLKIARMPVVLFPMSEQYDSDTVVHERIHNHLDKRYRESVSIYRNVKSARDAIHIINRSTLVIGMRLHSCVMAYACQKPLVCVEYNRKVSAFATTIGLPDQVLRPTRLLNGRSARLSFSAVAERANDIARHIEHAMTHTHFDALESLRARSADIVRQAIKQVSLEQELCG